VIENTLPVGVLDTLGKYISQATTYFPSTLGDPDDIMTSALYFNGPLTPDRLINITARMDNKGLYKKVLLRHQWVKHIEKNRLTLNFPSLETTTLFNWANSFRPSQEQIHQFHSIFAPSHNNII
jgi:hypothetical protein